MRRATLCAATLLLLTLCGCSSGPRFVEVSGVLKAGDQPLENVQVEFWPEVSGPRSLGVTDKDGRFTLRSEDGKHTGAVAGAHKVVLVDLAIYEKVPVNMTRAVENMDLKSTRFGEDYANPTRTPFQRVINADGTNDITLDVKAP